VQSKRTGLLILGWAAASFSPLALAALGGDLNSAQDDAVHMKAQARPGSRASSAYEVQELTLTSGTVVREYASPAGKVFAVTWHGPQIPDLTQLFGSYYPQFAQAAGAPHAGHRHLQVRQPDLVVESNGRMRAFHGLAYVPSLVPAGVQVAALP